MSLKSSLIALAENIGMCQENARSIKQALAGGLAEAGVADTYSVVKTVTADGVKTYANLLNEFAEDVLTDPYDCIFELTGGATSFYTFPTRQDATSIEFSELRIRSAGINGHAFVIAATNSKYYSIANGTVSDSSSVAPSAGTIFTLYK